MRETLFYGSGTALVTPFCDSGIDYMAWEKLIECQIDAGTDALIALGSTGEAATVTREERRKLISLAVDIASGELPVIVGVCSNSTKTAVELAETAREQGADGLLVSAPYYSKPTESGIYAHIMSVADSARIPVIAYNIPSRTGVNISVSLMGKLAKNPMIRGLKEASTDANHIYETVSRLSDGIAIYAGNDSQIIPIMSLGGRGAITVAGNIAPYEMSELTHALINSNIDKAREINARLHGIISALSVETNPIPIKYAMSLKGLCEQTLRLPLTELSDESKNIIESALSSM